MRRPPAYLGFLPAQAGIAVAIDERHAIAHNKAENLLIAHDEALATRYTGTWSAHAGHAKTYHDDHDH